MSGLGLPQINFDAPRLLAHAFLFEIDTYLNHETKGNFVRWMDDIDFAVQDIGSAKKILRGLDELLLTRGLRLNLGKTKILSSEEAKNYFLPNENRYLTIMTKRVDRLIDSGLDISDEKQKIRRRFKKFLNLPHIGRWEKVYKRYFTLSTKTKDTFLEFYVPELLDNNPDLRENIFRYYGGLGINKKRFEHIRNFMKEQNCLDDVAIFSAAKLLTDWTVSFKSKIKREMVDLAVSIAGISPAHLISSIWLLSKYGTSSELVSILDTTSYLWKYSSFLSRQVAATIPKIRDLRGDIFEKIFAETGQLDALRILYNLDQLRSKPLSKAEILYIMHGSKNDYYPLSKFIITLDLLSSPHIDPSIRNKLRTDLIVRIKDPIYIQQINRIRI
ncbi:RNA-directed DNA polymerase [Synechococcus sp. PCC 7502]|uniref:RNA-directed DNA polymerase n=1 Tax=Synechococcus sp. PCC 7502 TaxID=1173263 RepID=UPI001AEFA31D|nr:RNA-directed DNA polymerase [Synechococcus sp. PCC 7502]